MIRIRAAKSDTLQGQGGMEVRAGGVPRVRIHDWTNGGGEITSSYTVTYNCRSSHLLRYVSMRYLPRHDLSDIKLVVSIFTYTMKCEDQRMSAEA